MLLQSSTILRRLAGWWGWMPIADIEVAVTTAEKLR
jgi:hypothetical protein